MKFYGIENGIGIEMGLYRGTADKKYNPEMDSKILAEHLWPILKGIIMTAVEK